MATRKKTDKESIQKAAARAERRAKSAPKQDSVKPVAAAAPGANDTDEQNRALFLHHLPKIADLKDKAAKATANLRNSYKTAKADGFVKADFDEAFLIQGAEGEKKKKDAIKRSLQVARWLGCAIGAQYDLFDRMTDTGMPAEDQAFEQGKTDSLLGKSANPPYDPSLPQHAKYLAGFHDATAARVAAGITKLHPEVQKDEADKAAKKSQT